MLILKYSNHSVKTILETYAFCGACDPKSERICIYLGCAFNNCIEFVNFSCSGS